MQFVFESCDPRFARLRDVTEQRLRFVMRRAAFLVQRAKVRLTDLNGPRGGIDKRCRLELTPERGAPIVVVVTAQDWRHAFEDALARGSRALIRNWQKNRRVDRTSAARKTAGFGTAATAV